jgi:hypothetical protein
MLAYPEAVKRGSHKDTAQSVNPQPQASRSGACANSESFRRAGVRIRNLDFNPAVDSRSTSWSRFLHQPFGASIRNMVRRVILPFEIDTVAMTSSQLLKPIFATRCDPAVHASLHKLLTDAEARDTHRSRSCRDKRYLVVRPFP